jgi:hypothetical protein
MVIDGRDSEMFDLFLQLKEIFAAQCGLEVRVDVLVENFHDSKRIATFAAMSGCQTETQEREGCYVVRITGSICCG